MISVLLKVVCIILGVAFITLFERKILSLSQNRIGPNKVSLKGILQPVLDGIKLFLKERVVPNSGVYFLYFLSPIISFLVMLFIWLSMEEMFGFIRIKLFVMFFIVCIGVRVYSMLLSGWRRVSKFGRLGRIRACSQSVSYEVRLALFFISIVIFFMRIKYSKQLFLGALFVLVPIIAAWFISCLAETNRAPFDFREGERELISGFNIEFGAIIFTLLFLAEYGIIIFFSLFFSFLFCKRRFLVSFLIIFIFLLVRRVYPRFRYDKLMGLNWKILLPFSILFGFIGLLL